MINKFQFIVLLSVVSLFILIGSSITNFNDSLIGDIYAAPQDDDGYFIVFPGDYFDLGEYDNEFLDDEILDNNENTDLFLDESQTNNIENTNQFSNTGNSDTSDFNIVAVGDWKCNKDSKKTMNSLLKVQPSLVLGLGDYTFENPSPSCWFELSKPIDNIIQIAIGNHDLDYQSSYQQLIDHYGLKKPYYSFDYENVHFISISTEHPFEDDSSQYEFIKEDLRRAQENILTDWIIVFMHSPMYNSADFGENDSEDLQETYHPLFDKYGVDIVLSGHTQFYQRTLPITYNENNPSSPYVAASNPVKHTGNNGVIFIGAGTAGDDIHDIEYYHPFHAVQEDSFGFLNLEFKNNGKTIVGTFYDNEDLNILDRFSISKDPVDNYQSASNENINNKERFIS
ncbi:MAG: metallophosphoesterase [Nitrososphaeraceae archaeon]